jgi:hypothetical protein
VAILLLYPKTEQEKSFVCSMAIRIAGKMALILRFLQIGKPKKYVPGLLITKMSGLSRSNIFGNDTNTQMSWCGQDT